MTERRLFLDEAPGETRGVVFCDGAPERLFVERPAAPEHQAPGAVYVGRVRKVSAVLRSAFIDLGGDGDGLLPLGGRAPPAEGAMVEVVVATAPRRDKSAVLKLVGAAAGPPRLLRPAPDLRTRLQGCAPRATLETGPLARAAADLALVQALEITHPLKGGGVIHVEPTRALVAVDVDLGASQGDARRAAGRVNLAAIETCARILRLKRLGGVVAIDLVGKGHDGAALSEAARRAFAPEGAGVALGPISKFGVFELAVPRDAAPLSDLFLGEDGQETVEAQVYRLLRAVESAAGPGLQVTAACGATLFEAVQPFAALLRNRIGARFQFTRAPDAAPGFFDVRAA